MNDIEQILIKLFNRGYDRGQSGGMIEDGETLIVLDSMKAIEEYVKDRESITFAYGLLSCEAHQQDIIKARIDTSEKIKGNCASEEERIWIMHYIIELKKGLNEK